VYNHEYNITRLVDITPSRNWGGQGALGCTLGYGALHRIPPTLDEPPDAPGDTMFDTSTVEEKTDAAAASDAADFVVPAEQFVKAPPPPSKEERTPRHQTHLSPSADIDEYFSEEEERSREQDGTGTPKPTAGLLPPPKAGPKAGHGKE
jgi:hypothetical protein